MATVGDVTGPSLDLRLLSYFVVVAAHGNFGTAAQELHLAQPSLSRQIQRLEAQVGARLFDRTPRGSSLTEAGRTLRTHAHELLRDVERAVADTRAAVEPGRIALGHAGNLVLTPVARELRRRHPDAEVRTVGVDGLHPEQALHAQRVDVLIAREPLDHDGLLVEELYTEPRVLVVPVGHRLAERPDVGIADFADEPLVRYADETIDAWWRIDPRPDGRRAPDGPTVRAFGDKFEFVASGEALLVLPRSPAATGFRADVVPIPIRDAAPTPVVLATRAGSAPPLVAEARALAGELLGASG